MAELNTHLAAQSGSLYAYMSAWQHDGHRGQRETWLTGGVSVMQDLGESTEMQHTGQSDWLQHFGSGWGFGIMADINKPKMCTNN